VDALKGGEDSWIVSNEYDGSSGASPTIFGGDIKPSDAAQDLFDFGLIGEPTTKAMWEALDGERTSTTEYKKLYKEAKQAMRDARKQAKEETAAWQEEAEAKQKKDEKRHKKAKITADKRSAVAQERARMRDSIRDLARLDAMLKVMPPAVRARVGGFTQVAKIASAEGREAELKRRLHKMDHVLERELVKDGRNKVRDLIKKSDKKKNKMTRTADSKIGAIGHDIVDAAKEAMGMTGDEAAVRAQAEITKLEGIEDSTLDDIERYEGKAYAYELFADFTLADSNRLDEMVDFLEANYAEGRKAWLAELEKRKQWREENTSKMVNAIGGDVTDEQLTTAQTEGMKRKAFRGVGQTLTSFFDFMGFMGEKSKNPDERVMIREAASAFRRGVAAYENEYYARKDRLDDFLFDLFSIEGRGVFAKAKVDSSIGEFAKSGRWGVTKVTGRIVVKTSIPIADAEMLINREVNTFNGEHISDEELVNIENAYEEQFNSLEDDAKARKRVIKFEAIENEGTRTSIGEISQLSMLKDWLAVQQTDLREKYEKSGYDEQYIEELEAALDPKMIQLGQFLQNELREMTPDTNAAHEREYGLTMSQIENYFPAVFNNRKGNEGTSLTIDGVEVGQTSLRPASTKSRVAHRATPKVANALNVYQHHLNSVIYWKHMSEVMRMYGGVLRSQEMQDAMVVHMGQEYATNMMNRLKEVESRGVMEGVGNMYADEIVGRLGAGVALGVLGMKIKTIILNASGMLNVGMEVPASYLLKGVKNTSKKDFMEVWNSPTFQKRFKEGSRPEIIYALMAGKSGHIVPAAAQRAAEFGMQGISIADTASNMSTVLAYSARKKELMEAGLSEADAVSQALDYVDDIMSRAAQPTNQLSKSSFENNTRGVGKFMFMFASEARKHSSLMFLAWRKILRGKGEISTGMAFQRLIVGHILYSAYGLLANAMYRAFFKGEGDEEEPMDNFKAMATDPKEFGVEVVGSLVRGAPLMGEGVSALTAKVIGAKSFDSSTNPLMRLQRSVSKVKKVSDADNADEVVDAMLDIMQVIGSILPQTAIISQGANAAEDTKSFAANTLDLYITEAARFDAEASQVSSAKKDIYSVVLEEYIEQYGEDAKEKYKKQIDKERHLRLERYLHDLFLDYDGEDKDKLFKNLEEKNTVPKSVLNKVR